MAEIKENFSKLFSFYKDYFPTGEVDFFSIQNRKELQGNLRKEQGVYIMLEKGNCKPIYIGCSGKFSTKNKFNSSNVCNRILNSRTPYKVKDEELCFEPQERNKKNKMPQSYGKCIPLKNIDFTVFYTKSQKIAPACIEHLLIQSYINEFYKLPKVNRKI